MKAGSDRSCTVEFRDAAVKQVSEGARSMSAVARSLEMSSKTLANWVYRDRKGQLLMFLGSSCTSSDSKAASHSTPPSPTARHANCQVSPAWPLGWHASTALHNGIVRSYADYLRMERADD
jgi:transposase-like protein